MQDARRERTFGAAVTARERIGNCVRGNNNPSSTMELFCGTVSIIRVAQIVFRLRSRQFPDRAIFDVNSAEKSIEDIYSFALRNPEK